MTTIHREPLSDQLRRGVDEVRDVREEMMGLFDDIRVLAQKEMELARVEVSEQVQYVRNAAVFGSVAAVFALLTLAFLATTVMFALDEAMPLWVAALITTIGLLAILLLLGLVAYSQVKQLTVAPKKTMDSVNEDVRWARNRLNFSAR